MPFQVTFSTRHRQFKQVKLISAGDDQLHICSVYIYLEAIVEGDISGHTIEWEQLEGTVVNLLQANTLTPFFEAVDSTDKKFRIWIDKGTPYEQYADVYIWKTPTSLGTASFDYDNSYFNLTLNPQPVECSSITPFVDVRVPSPTSLDGEETGTQTVVVVSWDHPTNTVYQPYIAQYRVVENGTEVDFLPTAPIVDAGDGTGPPTETLTYDGTFAQYRIDTYYNIAGQEFVKESCTQDFSSLIAPSVKVYNDSMRPISYEYDQQYFTRTNYTNIVQSETSSGVASYEYDQQYFNRVNYSNLVESGTSIQGGVGFDPNAQWINITRYDPSGIGSG